MLRNIMTSEIIIAKQNTTRTNKKMSYTLNDKIIKFHIELNMFSNPYLVNFDKYLLNSINIQIPKREDEITFYDIPENEYNLICKIFRITRAKPSNIHELFKMYVSMIRNITTSEFVIAKQNTTRANKKMSYTLTL